MKYILITLSIVAVMGVVGQSDLEAQKFQNQVDLQTRMGDICYRSFKFHGTGEISDRGLEVKCGELIDQIQLNPKLEVLNDINGNFWVEEKN